MEQGQKLRGCEIMFHPIASLVRPPKVFDFRSSAFTERDVVIEFRGFPSKGVAAQIALRRRPKDFPKFGGRDVSPFVPSEIASQVVPSGVGAMQPIPLLALPAFAHPFRQGCPIAYCIPSDPEFLEWFCFLTSRACFSHGLNYTASGQSLQQRTKGGEGK